MKAKLYYQPGNDVLNNRIRIIYSNGNVEYTYGSDLANGYEFGDSAPCWADFTKNRFKSQISAIRAMNEYDGRQGFGKAWYLGEI